MPIPRPKFLPIVTVPTGGWQIKVYISDLVAFDTPVTALLTAGSYYLAFDQQDDDFARELMYRLYLALGASGVAGYNGADINGKLNVLIGPSSKVVLNNNAGMRIAWTELDGAAIADVLGFSSAANLDLTASTPSVADNRHAYGWYAQEDGQLESLAVRDAEIAMVTQTRAVGGKTVSHYITSHFNNGVALREMTRDLAFSGETAYSATPPSPFTMNLGLECWWRRARLGDQFRVYRDGWPPLNPSSTQTRFEHVGQISSGTATTLTDSSKSFATNELVGKLAISPLLNTVSGWVVGMYYITSNTATVLTLANSINNQAHGAGALKTYYVVDQTYGAYTLDLEAMDTFAPRELPRRDRYNIAIPMLRYVP